MKTTYIYIQTLICSLVIFLASGCAEEFRMPETEINAGGRLLSIQATAQGFTDTDSRTSDEDNATQFTEGDAIGVFAVNAEGKIVASCCNVKCTYSEADGIWNGRVYYFENTEYFAYYPYDGSLTTAQSVDDIMSAFTGRLEKETDQSTHELYTQYDLMTAENTAPNDNMELTFQFTHRMSMVEIELPNLEYKESESAAPYYITPIADPVFSINDVPVKPLMVSPGVYRCIVPPSESTLVYAEFETDAESLDYGQADLAFNAGKYKRLKITSDKTSIVHTLAIGDYFLKSGALVSKEAALTDRQKEDCIGVVFYVGNPAVTDLTLKTDHPDCTHGLVVALDEMENIKWCAETNVTVNDWLRDNTSYLSINTVGDDANTNNIVGYNNTMALDYYNLHGLAEDADIVVAANETMAYRRNNPMKCNASGWYLPSIKELSLMFNADGSIWAGGTQLRDELNIYINAAGGTELTDSYWSSTEAGTGSAHLMVNTGKPQGTRVFNNHKVRPVLAF